ncbi:MAG: hypothetical protein JOZ07_00205 [Solirubrobacterales bacterium]|nr:hypothetical protein [Solirubrobacterales bacterium]
MRALRQDGHGPRLDLLEAALRRLSRSGSVAHATYARRQLALLSRL